MVRIEWLLELVIFSLWEEFTLFFNPYMKCLRSYSADLHSYTNRFSTLNCSFLFQRSLRPMPDFKEIGFRRSNTLSL